MSETLIDRPPETMPYPEPAEVELQRDFDSYGPTEKAVADVALMGAGFIDTAKLIRNDGQLSIEDELTGYGAWPTTESEKGGMTSQAPESNYYHPPDMSSVEEANHLNRQIAHEKAYDDAKSDKIGWDEFHEIHEKIYSKPPREYQHPLLRQNGQLFEQEIPFVDNPDLGVGSTDGTFWHGSNREMEVGDRLMPSGEVATAVHDTNKSERSFRSESSPASDSYEDEVDFAFGEPRESGALPTQYGNNVYKVSAPNSGFVHTRNGKEVWAEGGGRIEKRMHPDFATNYRDAAQRVNKYPAMLDALPGMENGLQFVPEKELDVPRSEFYDKHLKQDREKYLRNAPRSNVGPADTELPGFEDYDKPPAAPVRESGSPPVM